MSFSNSDRDKIMGYLGIPITAEQVSYVAGVLTTIDAQSPDATSRIQGYLSTLAAIDTQIAAARNVGSKLPYEQLLNEGDRFARLLSASVGINLQQRIYG